MRSCFQNGGTALPGCKRQRHVVGKRLRPARRWIGPIHSKRRGNGGQPPKIPRAWKDSAQRRALPCHRSCFTQRSTVRQDVSAKGMPFGKRLRPARCWIGRFIRSAAEIWTDPEGSTRLGDDQSRSFSQNKANHDFALREATTAGRQHFAHPWVLYAGKALSAFAEVSPHAVDFACAQNKGAAGEEAMKEIPPKGGWARFRAPSAKRGGQRFA